MLISEDQHDSQYSINAYEDGLITINEKGYTNSLIVSTTSLIQPWKPQSIAALCLEDLPPIFDIAPDLVLLGTGIKFQTIDPDILSAFTEQNIHIEPMSTRSACKSFMALIAENRHVVAALLIE